MTKAELISKVSEQTGQTQVATGKFLEALTNTVKEAVKSYEKKGDEVSIAGFGTFLKVNRAERNGVNPSTKEKIVIAAKSAAKFKPSATFLN